MERVNIDNLAGAERAKLAAARVAIAEIRDGMKIGLGTGSTADWMIKCLAERVRDEKLQLECAVTSERSNTLARELGLNVKTLDAIAPLDLVIDGADEFDPDFTLIKGGGGAHLREKIAALNSARMIVITDPSKQVARLGRFPLPVEVIALGHNQACTHMEKVLKALGYEALKLTLRAAAGTPFVSDEGNYIYDLALGEITDPRAVDSALISIPGIIETGLFIGVCKEIIIGYEDGRAKTLQKR